MKDIRGGQVVLFVLDGQIHYRRVKSLVMTADGPFAVFDDGCVKDAFKVPFDEVFTTKEEFQEYLAKGEK